jgi:aspartyl-tRNA(Asn)/glutamyl-tRNA(Gln) amidotransferase subunit C
MAGLENWVRPPVRSRCRSGGVADSPRLDFAEELTRMSLSNADVAKVALLARLRIGPDELEMFTDQLNSIIDYVEQLQELDTTGVEPLAHGVEVRNVFRDDVRGEALPREQALANAPKRNATSFLVPAVLD